MKSIVILAISLLSVSAAISDDHIQNVRDSVYERYRMDNGRIGGYLNRIFQKHEYDSLKFYPSFNELKNAHIPKAKKVRGTMTYAGRFVKPYAYDVEVLNGEVTLRVGIHFRNASAKDKELLAKNLKESSIYWSNNLQNDLVSFPVNFNFHIEENRENAHFSVKTISNSTLSLVHGPYDVKWSSDWGVKLMSHEIGHMLGLNDEYHYGSLLTAGLFNGCDKASLMCSRKGRVQVNHSYFILRRIIEEK